MERGAKRKAAPAASPAVDGCAAKRQKTPQDHDFTETAESTTAAGLRFVEQLKLARDKNGRDVSTAFLSLPNERDLPDYYEQIALPLSIDTIEAKLTRGGYATLTNLESDVKRMVNNAKTYNQPSSQIFGDAERIRKFTSNWMVKANPAYRDPGYSAFATSLPDETKKRSSSIAHLDATDKGQPGTGKRLRLRAGNTPQTAQTEARRSSSAELEGGLAAVDEEDAGFVGKSFQQAQEQIVREMIDRKNFVDFVNLPHRTLTQYCSFIGPSNVTSLKRVRDKVTGKHGRVDATGVTDMKSWDAFEKETRRIWDNARAYNEDGSVIYDLAGELEAFFKERLAEAKRFVKEPPQPTLKLKMGSSNPPIKLRLTSQKPSPSPALQPNSSSALLQNNTGMSVDQMALQRQKELVEAGVNAIAHSTPGQTPLGRPIPGVEPPPSLGKNISGSARSPPAIVNGLQEGRYPGPAPAQDIANNNMRRPYNAATTTMPPPSTTAPLGSRGSPHPTQLQPSAQAHVPHHASPTGFDSKWRQAGKDASDALFTSLNVTSHPDLHLPHPLQLAIPPHPYLSHQSITLNLPTSHYYLHFEPILASGLGASASASAPNSSSAATPTPRPFKMFVVVNGQRVQAITLPAHDGKETTRLRYDVKLVPGMNRVEVECVAQTGNGATKGLSELEVERCSVFVHLIKT